RGGLERRPPVAPARIEKILEGLELETTLGRGDNGATVNELRPLIPGPGEATGARAPPRLTPALRGRTTLEGKPAVAFPARFVDGAVFLGPFQVGVVPPLF